MLFIPVQKWKTTLQSYLEKHVVLVQAAITDTMSADVFQHVRETVSL